MTTSGLPQASLNKKNFRLGNILINNEGPKQSVEEAKKGIDNLEKAAKEKIFIENESTDKTK